MSDIISRDFDPYQALRNSKLSIDMPSSDLDTAETDSLFKDSNEDGTPSFESLLSKIIDNQLSNPKDPQANAVQSPTPTTLHPDPQKRDFSGSKFGE